MNTRIRLIHRSQFSCEPILRRCPNGDLLCLCQIGGVTEPSPDNRVAWFRSQDNGETWSAPVNVHPEDGRAVYATEVFLLDDVIYAFLTFHNGKFVNWTCTTMQSRDNGHTWEDIGVFPGLPNYSFVRGMIRRRNGEIVIPYQHYPVTPEDNERLVKQNGYCWDSLARYVENGVFISRDQGKSYTRYPGVQIPLKGENQPNWTWTEPTLAELSDGTLVMLLRVCKTNYLWRSESTDGGITWSEAVKTDIPNPSNKPKLLALPRGRIALIHTPNFCSPPGVNSLLARVPLSVWISDDDMKTWGYQKVISDFPGGFCYPDGVVEEDGRHIRFSIEYSRYNLLFIDHEVESSPEH